MLSAEISDPRSSSQLEGFTTATEMSGQGHLSLKDDQGSLQEWYSHA